MQKAFDKDTLRKRITDTRHRKGMSQAQLADESGVTPAAISQIESGRRVPTIPVLHRIASILGVSIDYLTGKTDEPELEDLLQHEDAKAYYRGFQSLDTDHQKVILEQIEFLRSRKSKDKKK